MTKKPLIKINKLNVEFPLGRTLFGKTPILRAVNNVSLEILPGQFYGLVGESGSGKTTLGRAILRAVPISSGEIKFDDSEVNYDVENLGKKELKNYRKLAQLIFQDPYAALSPRMTVRDIIAEPLEVMGFKKHEMAARVKKVLELVDLSGFEKKYPWQLSGGMQQRVSIARALCFDANILLMDEPFGALDEIVRDYLNEQLLKLWNSTNKTICFVTHSIPEAVYLSTKIVVMSPRPGRIIDIIESDLPNERPLEIRDSKKFISIAQRVREGLRAGHSYE